MKNNNIKYIIVVGKYTDRNGNTYHNAEIYNTLTKEYSYTGVNYGYDNAYQDTLKKTLTDFNYNNSFVASVVWTNKKKLYNNTFNL